MEDALPLRQAIESFFLPPKTILFRPQMPRSLIRAFFLMNWRTSQFTVQGSSLGPSSQTSKLIPLSMKKLHYRELFSVRLLPGNRLRPFKTCFPRRSARPPSHGRTEHESH